MEANQAEATLPETQVSGRWPYDSTTEERNAREAELIARFAPRFVGEVVTRRYSYTLGRQEPVVLVAVRPSGFLHLAVKKGRELRDPWIGPPLAALSVGLSFYRMTSGDAVAAPPAWSIVEQNCAVHWAISRSIPVPGVTATSTPGPVLSEGGTIVLPGSSLPVFPSVLGVDVPAPVLAAYRLALARSQAAAVTPVVPPAPAATTTAPAAAAPGTPETPPPAPTPPRAAKPAPTPDPELAPDPAPAPVRPRPGLPHRTGPGIARR